MRLGDYLSAHSTDMAWEYLNGRGYCPVRYRRHQVCSAVRVQIGSKVEPYVINSSQPPECKCVVAVP